MPQDQLLAGILRCLALCLCAYAGSLILAAAAPARQALPLAAVETARIYHARVGVRERSGANDGPEVERYLAYTGLGKGHAWCAAFVCWVYGQAGVANPRSAWSPALFPASKTIWKQGRRNTLRPRRADVFGIWYADKGRIAHAGFIDHWDGKWAVTVEGNTTAAGSREGDGVYRKRRPVKSIYRVARWID